MSEAFGFDKTSARAVVEICLGVMTAAGTYLRTSGATRSDVEALTVTMMMGAVRAAADLKAPRPRRRAAPDET